MFFKFKLSFNYDLDQAADITRVKELLGRCFEFYNNESLKSDCEYWKCNTPAECMQFNAVYNIFHFLLDSKVNVRTIVILFGLIL